MAKTNQPNDKIDLATLESLPPEQQAAVLSAPGAVWGLAYNGETPRTVALIEKLAPEQQAEVLSAPYAVSGLRSNGHRAALEKLLKSQTKNPAQTRDC